MIMIIERKLYELKRSGSARRAKLAETLKSFGYKSPNAYADVWIKWDFKPNIGTYYKYMLCYVDDLLDISFMPIEDMNALNLI